MMASPSKTEVYDVIVVGAGIEGSATAYTLAKHNYNTLLLEQFAVPHTRGSSHGQSRIIRKAYEQDYYAKMMVEAYPLWARLESEDSVKLLEPTGLLAYGVPGSNAIKGTRKALESIGSAYLDLNPVQLQKRYPMMNFHGRYEGVYDPDGGVLRADRALRAFWNQFQKHGGTFRDGEQVTLIRPGPTVTVTTPSGQYMGKSIVLCAGPWTDTLVRPLGLHLPLQPVRVTVCYWKQREQLYDASKKFPSFIVFGEEKDVDLYGLPALEYPNCVKICSHGGPAIDPDARDAIGSDQDIVDNIARFVREHFPGVEDKPSVKEMCIYTNTPDDDFILDTHPGWKNIVIGAGFSGHGFKLAPIVGKVLSELATGRKPSYDMSPFRINRFFKKPPPAQL